MIDKLTSRERRQLVTAYAVMIPLGFVFLAVFAPGGLSTAFITLAVMLWQLPYVAKQMIAARGRKPFWKRKKRDECGDCVQIGGEPAAVCQRPAGHDGPHVDAWNEKTWK